MKTTITHDDWVSALGAIQKKIPVDDDPAVKTTLELQEIWKCGKSSAQLRARALVKAGRATITKKFVTRSDGGHYPAPAYRLVAPLAPSSRRPRKA